MLKSDLHEVELPFGKTIFQFKNQGVSSDSKLLFDEIKQENLSNAFCLELGCGNGIISLMLAHYHPDWQIIAIDIQLKLIQLAKKNNAEIISADSMQVYRHMDIGTAKPSKEEMQEVCHHLINIVDPDTPFSVADYLEHFKNIQTKLELTLSKRNELKKLDMSSNLRFQIDLFF